jgi:hypothetical protein
VVGFFQSKLGKTVFRDLHVATGTLHLTAKRFQIGHGQTGILREDDRSSAREG